MITGDQALTACHVAAQVHIVTRPVLILTQRSGDLAGQFDWLSPDEKLKLPYKYVRLYFHPLIWLSLLQEYSKLKICVDICLLCNL